MMYRGAATGVTIEDYLAYQPPSGMKDELIQGAIVLSPSAMPDHADICAQLYDLLRERLRGSAFVVRLDTSMRLDESESMPRPDVFVIDAKRWKAAGAKKTYPVGSPQLAIEVFSPSNATKEFRLKPSLYLASGACAVWVVHPESRTVEVHTRQGMQLFGMGQKITLPAPLPTGTIAIKNLFPGEPA